VKSAEIARMVLELSADRTNNTAEEEWIMKIPAVNRVFSVGLLAASFALALGLAPKPKAQNRATQPPASYEFTVKRGDHKTNVNVMIKDGRINSVSGIRNHDTFNFKRVKAGEKLQLTGRPEQTLKCGLLKPGNDLNWTLCFYADKSDDDATVIPTGAEYVDEWKNGDGFVGGGGSPCWENNDLQMSICVAKPGTR
jgi:hypothetical protein